MSAATRRWIGAGLLALIAPLCFAQADTGPDSLDELLRSIREVRSAEQQAMREREQRFIAERDQRQQTLREAEQALAEVQAQTDRLQAEFERLESELGEAQAQLDERSGNLGELFGVVRQMAADTRGQWRDSLLNARFPQRTEGLQQLEQSRSIPTVEELEQFWYILQQDMTASGQVSRFTAAVAGRDGQQQTLPVVAVGPFVALQGDDYLLYEPDANRFMVAARQPGDGNLAEDFVEPRDELADLWVDPTRGNVLAQQQLTPSLLERVRQGGLVGYVILGLGLLGLLLAIGRLIWLQRVSRRVDRQADDLGDLRTDNPLGRVLGVIGDRPRLEEIDTLELKLDEAILRETPRLERWQGLIKLLAAVAPLLGLLGTVTGMIATFQAITLYGTGDPKMMAGGISQALVTTVLGLVVAIPLLFLHSLVAARSKALVQLLEQQSAGLIALHLGNGERRGD
ncbi:outer membrane transport energization protein ExbB [Halopseudomonas xinjiangensis]|uniref:Outer membrane transport energization protein ExbB n=1 Tax=Halopseudomonas xinjiangensis TaxID=487184 RepID=A0A1H1WNG8_9GAMM|nr:MotA/TolQ/ExbB proton channel family protein [Halopseudomonas xinjiangensis]SDS98604.1 outer membrane transport energization protein ExbB [Halopseudomonas xinjiangensis]